MKNVLNESRRYIKISEEELEQSKLETDKKVLKKWATSKLKKQRLKAASNPNTPMATLKRLQGYPEENSEIMHAAQENPQMYSKEDGDMWAQAESRVKKSRVKAAKNPNLPANIISLLLKDSDDEVAMTAARNKNIAYENLELLKDTAGINTMVFRPFLNNKMFKKEWIIEWLDIMQEYNLDTLKYLEDNRFFDNENEWLDLYEECISRMPGYLSSSKIASFWFNFFAFPKENYSENVILTIFNDWSKEIIEYAKGILYKIAGTPMETEKIRNLFYKLSGDETFLSDEVKDIFVF